MVAGLVAPTLLVNRFRGLSTNYRPTRARLCLPSRVH